MVEQKNNSKSGEDDVTPSTQRRKLLRENDSKESNVPTVSSFIKLDNYYNASDKLIEVFESAYGKKSLNDAYIYGIRYSDFVVKGIPKHDYYNSSQFKARRIESLHRVSDVMTKLETIKKLMDEEEIEKEKRRLALIERQKRERERIQREREARQMEELQARIAKQKEDYSSSSLMAGDASSTTTNNNVEESALAKLQRLSQPQQQQQPIPPAMPPPPAEKRVSFSEDTTFSDASNNGGSTSELPPPLLPPPEGHEEDDKSPAAAASASAVNGATAPPSYNQILGKSKNYFGQKRPTTEESSSPESGSAAPTLPSYDAVVKKQKPSIKKQQQQPPKRPKAPTHNIRQHIEQCRRLHHQFLSQRKIQISPMKTHQGRVNGSTNGCTVISACVVSRHLESRNGASTDLVQNVIDRDCIPLLRTIRSKLGLTGSALIIPSDVHDHLVDHKWLFQHKFVGAAGGNVTDPNHLGELFKLLQGEPNKTSHLRSAATFFFREHVISIVKFPTSMTDAVYDVIDSLPTCNGGASRTRCTSLQALKVHMEKYTCAKFSPNNISYIERNRWDDSMADFDPRVFQTFVWADLPKPKE